MIAVLMYLLPVCSHAFLLFSVSSPLWVPRAPDLDFTSGSFFFLIGLRVEWELTQVIVIMAKPLDKQENHSRGDHYQPRHEWQDYGILRQHRLSRHASTTRSRSRLRATRERGRPL